MEVGVCDICKRFTIRSNILLIHPPNVYKTHADGLRCPENSKNICFSCKLSLKDEKFFLKVLMQIYKEKGIEEIMILQDLALDCNSSRLMTLFRFEENIRKIELNRKGARERVKLGVRKYKEKE